MFWINLLTPPAMASIGPPCAEQQVEGCVPPDEGLGWHVTWVADSEGPRIGIVGHDGASAEYSVEYRVIFGAQDHRWAGPVVQGSSETILVDFELPDRIRDAHPGSNVLSQLLVRVRAQRTSDGETIDIQSAPNMRLHLPEGPEGSTDQGVSVARVLEFHKLAGPDDWNTTGNGTGGDYPAQRHRDAAAAIDPDLIDQWDAVEMTNGVHR